MDITLTEEMIRQRTSEQSFRKGWDYYRAHSIFDEYFQTTPNGIVLYAQCRGSYAPSYYLRAVLTRDGISSATCTCPYDYGGDCKHIVALLLKFLQEPETFPERTSLNELVAGLEKDELEKLLIQLLRTHPDLYNQVELSVALLKLASTTIGPEHPGEAGSSADRSADYEKLLRKQVKRILAERASYGDEYEDERDYGYGYSYSYEEYAAGDEYAETDEDEDGYDYDEEGDYWAREPAYLDQLESIVQVALKHLADGSPRTALTILRILLEESIEAYPGEGSFDGGLEDFIEGLGMPLAEAILGAELDEQERDELRQSMETLLYDLPDEVYESSLEVIMAALECGMEGSVEGWISGEELIQARLNVLERQGRIDEYLERVKVVNTVQYVHKLLELDRLDDAMAVSQEQMSDVFYHRLAEKLHQAGRTDEAIDMALRGLEKQGSAALDLYTWLAPVADAQGKTEIALKAYIGLFNRLPSLPVYRAIKRLSGEEWESMRPAMIARIETGGYSHDLLLGIYMEEGSFDEAIALAESRIYDTHLLAKVVKAVLPHRPDWAIRQSIEQAEAIIAQTNSTRYLDAARWLEYAKEAYLQAGRMDEWEGLIAQVREVYYRRKALLKAIAHL